VEEKLIELWDFCENQLLVDEDRALLAELKRRFEAAPKLEALLREAMEYLTTPGGDSGLLISRLRDALARLAAPAGREARDG